MSHAATRRIKLLLVDDEQELLRTLAVILEKLDYEVLTATNTNDATELINKHGARLAAIVSDLQMPGDLDGIQFRQKILEQTRSIPFIILSGYITRELALKALELKVSAFIEKPFEKDNLIEIFRKEAEARILSIREEDELLDGFVTEAQNLIEEMESLILAAEETAGDPTALNRIFACAHTIKGSSSYFKPDYLHRFSHKFEDYLSRFKNSAEVINATDISVCLKAIDILKELLQNLHSGESVEIPLEKYLQIFTAERTKEIPESRASNVVATTKVEKETKNTDIRIQMTVLDDFMERSGEITVLRNMVNKTVRSIEKQYPSNSQVTALTELLTELHKANSLLQEKVSDLRKVQLKQIFKPLHRTLRDLSFNLKKNMILTTQGEELRVDHALAEALSKCLIHMLRNSADHGIESSEERSAKGKSSQGTITVSINYEGEFIFVQFQDDGRGIDAQKIKLKAVEKGVLASEKANKLSDSELLMLIFHPGFSTAEKVTDVSGRGVGMDMVKTTISRLGGEIGIESTIGAGTVFSIKLPLPKSVLIISSLLVKGAGQLFAIPQDSIDQVIEVGGAHKIQYIKNDRFYVSGSEFLPVLSLSKILESKPESPPELQQLIVLNGKVGRYCLEVDEIFDIEDTVVKNVGPWLESLDVYAGATFLGDGRVGLILNVDALSRTVGPVVKDRTDKLNKKNSSAEKRDCVLIVDSGLKTLFGFRQSEIFRLEELQLNAIQYSGRQQVFIYRDRVTPIYSLARLFGGENPSTNDKSLHMVMIEKNAHFLAFSVGQILDLVELTPGGSLSTANGETRVVNGRTITMLEIERLLTFPQISKAT